MDRNFKLCPDADCHEERVQVATKSQEVHEYLFREGGVRDMLNTFVTKKNVWVFLATILSILVGAFIIINTMWADTRDLTKYKEKADVLATTTESRVTKVENKFDNLSTRMDRFETDQDTILKNTEQLLLRLPDAKRSSNN
jgi:hypothetical protein